MNNTNVTYVKWSFSDEKGPVDLFGVLTGESEDSYRMLLKNGGEVTFEKTDGTVEEVEREVFESVEVVKEKEIQVVTRSNSKMSQAVDIYVKMRGEGKRRCEVIREFMEKLEMSKDGAGTYYQNIKKSRGD